MPFQLEKGPIQRLIEQNINASRSEMRAMLHVLRQSEAADDIEWVNTLLPELWNEPAFSRAPQGTGVKVRDHIVKDWFGYELDPETGKWVKGAGPDTGFWLAYKGDVDRIVRRALRWALELSLGVAPGDEGPGRQHPWQIELFWKCLAPWFETWVVHRPVANSGLVSVFFVTPTHRGANIAESPIATSATASVTGVSHTVPSDEDDYEVLGEPHPHDPLHRPRVHAIDRTHGTWVVTHHHHESGDVVSTTNLVGANNVGPTDFQDWGIPQLSRYHGKDAIVVVAPSMAAGGVKHDGSV
ncbi:MAG TPA: hypothetical protein VGJ86_03340 [Acidimicrobiales bacterium]|jgi:hypothetical protein